MSKSLRNVSPEALAVADENSARIHDSVSSLRSVFQSVYAETPDMYARQADLAQSQTAPAESAVIDHPDAVLSLANRLARPSSESLAGLNPLYPPQESQSTDSYNQRTAA